MSKQPEPKKPRRSKSKKINLSNKDQWERLLKEVYKEQVPVNVLRFITVNLTDGTSVDVDIEQMLAEGLEPEYVEELLNSKLKALDHVIDDVDFHINVDSVAKVVQPFTDQLLKGL
jgi:hypothetical protein